MQEKILQDSNKKNLLQLILLRTIAIIAQAFTIYFVDSFFEIELPIFNMMAVLLILILSNSIAIYRYKKDRPISDLSLFLELLFDVLALTAQLYFSGGATNPFISLFLLQVIIAAILLREKYTWLICFISVLCYVFLSFFYQEIHGISHHSDSGEFLNLHLHGMLVSYVIAAILLVIFITRISRNLRQRDEKLLEQQDILRSAILAVSAAHNLGTPLATISVILNDWKKLGTTDKDLTKDIAMIESQVERCKKTISEILSESGKERVESAAKK